MKVQAIMIAQPLTCGPHWSLADVARLMWDGDCGIVPVVNHEGVVIDVLTDRDICIAAATRNRTPADIQVGELERGRVVSCRPDDDLQAALGLMKQHRVRRLPVTDHRGALKGILSINDIVLAADSAKTGVTSADVLDAFRVICARPRSTRRSHTASG